MFSGESCEKSKGRKTGKEGRTIKNGTSPNSMGVYSSDSLGDSVDPVVL